MLVREGSKRGIVNQFFHQWFEREMDRIRNGDMPDQCDQCEGSTPMFAVRHRDMEDENDNNHHDDQPYPPVFLSQESDDDMEAEDDNDHRLNQDVSPVPVRVRNR